MEEQNNNLEQSTEVVEEPVVEEPIVESVQPVEETKVEPTESVVEQPVVESVKPTEKPKKKKTGLLIIIMLLLIGAILGGTLYTLTKGDKKSNNNDKRKTYVEITPDPKASEYRIKSNGLEDFDFYFLKIENKKENKVYSPLSIKAAMAMLSAGAEEETKKQIDNMLGEYIPKKYVNSENMSFANALFINQNTKTAIKDSYKEQLASKYNAEVITGSFETPDIINNWVKEKTLQILDNITDDISDLDFALVNALAIDMEWEEKWLEPHWQDHSTSATYYHITNPLLSEISVYKAFPTLRTAEFETTSELIAALYFNAAFNRYDIISELGEDSIRQTVRDEYKKYLENLRDTDYTYETLFPNGRTEETIEQRVDEYDYDKYIEEISQDYNSYGYSIDFQFYTDNDVRIFAKDLKEYNGTTLQYIGIMPINESLDTYIENITADDINQYINSLKDLKIENFKEGYLTEVYGYVPKFIFEYTLDLQTDLQKLGIIDVFNSSKANLSGITDGDAYISSVEHKAKIDFNQDGIKAAAATELGGRGAGGSWDYYFEVPIEKIDLTFDKPYLFIIRDKATGEVWFTGTVYNPLLKSEDSSNYL